MDDSGSVYTGILSYGTGFFLLLLVLVFVIVWRMKTLNKKAMNTPTVQKVSKFPLKRQVTESRYKIPILPYFYPPTPFFLFVWGLFLFGFSFGVFSPSSFSLKFSLSR